MGLGGLWEALGRPSLGMLPQSLSFVVLGLLPLLFCLLQHTPPPSASQAYVTLASSAHRWTRCRPPSCYGPPPPRRLTRLPPLLPAASTSRRRLPLSRPSHAMADPHPSRHRCRPPVRLFALRCCCSLLLALLLAQLCPCPASCITFHTYGPGIVNQNGYNALLTTYNTSYMPRIPATPALNIGLSLSLSTPTPAWLVWT